MNFIETDLKDLIVIENRVFTDERGYLSEIYKEEELSKQFNFRNVLELEVESVQGVLRGMHYQLEPYAQAKIVRVVSGEILDVVVDLRKSSPTFGNSYSIVLSEANKKQLYVPRGFAHGYKVLSQKAKMIYKMDNIYHPDSARGIMFDDSQLAINWDLTTSPILSEQDKHYPQFNKAEIFQ